MKTEPAIDKWFLGCSAVLLGLGILFMASASMVISDHQYGHPFHYLLRQSIYLLVSLVAAIICANIPSQVWYKWGPILLLLAAVLLLLVLIPGIGYSVNGSRRWLNLGIMKVQVSEFAKLAMIIYMAGFMQRYTAQARKKSTNFLMPLLPLAILSILLLCEPDFGSVVVLATVVMALLFIAGMPLRLYFFLSVTAVLLATALAVLAPYRLLRLTAFMHPWADPFNSGYQLTQSLIAFGRGGLMGVGLGNSVQKLFYLPEAHTDFLFAVIAEEWGLLGTLSVLALFTILIWRLFVIAQKHFNKKHIFHAYLATGIGLWFAAQVAINIGVCTGLLPTKGLTLPLMSFGGSSLLTMCVALGMTWRLSREK